MAQGREGHKGKVTPPAPPSRKKDVEVEEDPSRDPSRDPSQEITALTEKAIPADSPLAIALGDVEEILERVLRIDPRCDWALRQLIVSMTLAQRWDALLAVYDRALGSGPDRERRVALLSEAAQVAKDFVGRQELAITYLQEL